MNDNNTKVAFIYVLFMLVTAMVLMTLSEPKDKFEPIKFEPEPTFEAAHTLNHVESEESDPPIYAGRFDDAKSEYNSLGLPKDRYWLTRKEWRGSHIRSMNIPNDEKRLLLNRFRMWKRDHIKTFIEHMSKVAKKEVSEFPDIPPSLIVAQAIMESNFGLSRLAINARNYFGHKYRGRDKAKFLVAADDSPTDKFRKFKSAWFSIRAHSKLLMKNYRGRIKGKPTLDKWLVALCGSMDSKKSEAFVNRGNYVYATSCFKGKCYAEKLKHLITKYNLK